MKKRIWSIVAMVMGCMLVFCACTNTAPPAEESSSAAQETASESASADATPEQTEEASETAEASEPAGDFATELTYGMNLFSQGAYAFDVMGNQTSLVMGGDGLNNQMMFFNDEANVEKITTNLENMINSEVDGILWWAVLPTHYAVGPDLVEESGIPFAMYSAYPTDEETRDYIRNLSTFAGVAGESNYQAGAQLAEQAIADGKTDAIIMANLMGSAVSDRAVAFQEVFEAGGGTVHEVSHEGTASNAHITAMQNMLATYPDIDTIYCAGADLGLGAVSVVENLGKDISVYATDITPETLDFLVEGKIAALNGGQWISAMCSAIMLQNAVDGHKLLEEDGLPMWQEDVPLIVVPSNQAELYTRFWMDELPFELDDVKNLLYRFNPDVTTQDMRDFIENYSLESVLKMKYDSGKVTKEELAAVGIEVE